MEEYLALTLKQQEKLEAAIVQCKKCGDETAASSIGEILEQVKKSCERVKSGELPVSSLKKYKCLFTIPRINVNSPAVVRCRCDQKLRSVAMPIDSFIEVEMPWGPKYSSPHVVTKNTCQSYSFSFEIPDRSMRTISTAKAADIIINMYEFHLTLGKKTNTFIGKGSSPIAPLCYQSTSSAEVEVLDPKGNKTGYVFDLTISIDMPIIPEEGDQFTDLLVMA